jgi:hypothetical protein
MVRQIDETDNDQGRGLSRRFRDGSKRNRREEARLQSQALSTDGKAGLRVVSILDAAQRSIKAQGGRITL